MVKSVVKPLKMGFLRESIMPKKSVFVRLFGVFCFEIPLGRCLAPKARALPTAPHPERLKILNFWSFSVSGQICGQTTWNGIFARGDSAEKVSVYKGFRRFLLRDASEAVSCSQTSRATNCATSRKSREESYLPRYYSKHRLLCQVFP